MTGGTVRDTLASSAATMMFVVVGPFSAAAVIAAIAGGAAQVGFQLRPKAARPKLSRAGLRAGLERLRPATAFWELGRTAVKLALLVVVVWLPAQGWREQIGRGWTFESGLAASGAMLATVVTRAIAVIAVVAVADLLWNRRKLRRDLRMTKDEVRRETKDQLGDPLLRARRSERARQLSRNRMLAGVAHADAVIVNPTHLAVALQYVPSEPAPRVVAKGADRLAAKICAEARRHGVLVTQNIPLARTLYRRVKPGEFIPHALFEAVAVVLATAYRRRARPRVALGSAAGARL